MVEFTKYLPMDAKRMEEVESVYKLTYTSFDEGPPWLHNANL